MSTESWFIVSSEWHNEVVRACYLKRGFEAQETEGAVRLCESAARNGIRTHNAIKAFHLDDLFGSKVGGCIPGAPVTKLKSRFPASQVWNANKKLGPPVAYEAMATCIKLAAEYGVGIVSIDNAFHYLWGGAYVLDAADHGFIGYTNCTSALAEVVPYGGKIPALGTNPHSWAFPTQKAIGFPILVDWATSAVSMGRVQQLAREGRPLPDNVAVDSAGAITTDPKQAAGLLPFGGHKGYGLGLIDEIFAAMIGGYLPKLRGHPAAYGEKNSSCFHFMAIHPEALSSGEYVGGCGMEQNVQLVLEDILAGNEGARLPGAKAAAWRERCRSAGGLLFTESETNALNELARDGGVLELRGPLAPFNVSSGSPN
ncbi:MAG TPA: Ldh family oxidoreductase [Verrucomicrobiae bacterium]|jgi:L-2-hydroxycarboxylate dehydrogenase (NAD+)|nr:Ldh family oxidoreductase [Verrucomicrobiae bacterium]